MPSGVPYGHLLQLHVTTEGRPEMRAPCVEVPELPAEDDVVRGRRGVHQQHVGTTSRSARSRSSGALWGTSNMYGSVEEPGCVSRSMRKPSSVGGTHS